MLRPAPPALQAMSTLPPLPQQSARLFPDGIHEVEQERLQAIK